jgi:hypothetical protein
MASYTEIKQTFTRNKLADKIVNIAFKNDLIVFGGYVRDRDILGLETFNDIDIACFDELSYLVFVECLQNEFFMTEITKQKTREETQYARTSQIITHVNVINIIGIYSVRFPENMHISIDVVMQKSQALWEESHDIDFSCNLFYRDRKSLGLRYLPDIDTNETDPFTFVKNMTLEKKFIFVMETFDDETHSNDVVQKLLSRANKLIEKNWEMYYSEKCPFNLGTYDMIKIKDKTQCSVCISDFENESLIVNTCCKHSFCKGCFEKNLQHSGSCPNCRHTICSHPKKVFLTYSSPIQRNRHLIPIVR